MKITLVIIIILFCGSIAFTQSDCSCVEYVKCKLGIKGPTAHAKDWGPILEKNGYKKVVTPKYGDIVVMNANHPKLNGKDEGHGHIGICTYAISISKKMGSKNLKGFKIDLTGANQFQRVNKIECGCKNVSKWAGIELYFELSQTDFYRK